MNYIPKLNIAVLVILTGALWPVSAMAASNGRCYAPKTEMKFGATISKVKYNISESASDLHGMHGGAGGGLVTGLAHDAVFYDFQGLYKIRQLDDGSVCLSMDKLKVFYRARPIVFISNEFPRGSCEFNAVLAHENKHVSALKKYHKRSSKKFKSAVENAVERLRPVGPIPVHKVKAAQKDTEKRISELLDRALMEVRDELSREQNKIDSPKEYERVSAQCDGWVQRLRLE